LPAICTITLECGCKSWRATVSSMSYRRALIKRSASAAYGLKFSGTSDWNLSNGDVCGSLLSKSRRRAEDSK
jgi:hypothetical protein